MTASNPEVNTVQRITREQARKYAFDWRTTAPAGEAR